MKHDVNEPVYRIRIRMFLGLPDPDPLVRGTYPRIQIRIRICIKMSQILYYGHHFDAEPGPTFHFDADLYSDPTSSYTQVATSDFFTFIHSNAISHCFIFFIDVIDVIIFRMYSNLYRIPYWNFRAKSIVYLYIGRNGCRPESNDPLETISCTTDKNTTEHFRTALFFREWHVGIYVCLREMTEGVANVANIARQVGEAVSVSVRPQFCIPSSDSQRTTILYLNLFT